MDASAGMTVQAAWVVLTRGDRPAELRRALHSIVSQRVASDVVVVDNGGRLDDTVSDEIAALGARLVTLPTNVGIPSGRDIGMRNTDAEIVCFLDDDAELMSTSVTERILAEFDGNPMLAAVSLHIRDENGTTSSRHCPRPGGRRTDVSGQVATFLGGASALRRAAYRDAGGYFAGFWYGHEELDLSWRLIDRGWNVRYLADLQVFHPRHDISRHASGWFLTGRNRVLLARRRLPWPLHALHTAVWFVAGLVRAPGVRCKRAYARGWVVGWTVDAEHQPMRWSTVWRLTQLGRPPVI